MTLNGGQALADTLDALSRQTLDTPSGRLPQPEIVAIDSGSSDQSLALLERHGARLQRIAPEEFGHGRTRQHRDPKTTTKQKQPG